MRGEVKKRLETHLKAVENHEKTVDRWGKRSEKARKSENTRDAAAEELKRWLFGKGK